MENKKNQSQPTRLSDIANAVGVSRITVSKVLLGTGGQNVRVSEPTKNKILAVAFSMNYRPNMAARTLAGKRSGILGLLIDSHSAPRYYECLKNIETAASEKGYRLMIAQQHENADDIIEHLMDFCTYGAEGIISFVHDYPGLKDKINEFMRIIPHVVYIGKPDFEPAASVEVDTEGGIRMIMEHLIKEKRKRVL